MKTIFGIKDFPLTEYAIAANAILGIRDSGKTYTATEASEELFDAGIPFIWLDPIGVAHNLRIPGKGRGYPVVVAGGQHGDLPLSPKNVGEIVRAAMKANISLVLDLFSRELSKADWKRIVRETCEILLHENAEYGLRHVFLEEAAEFVPQRMTGADGQVFSAVEKLVRMGGNSKVGITLINQRSADLNKSVLELCANVFVHRQKGKNTLLDLKKWLSLTDPETEKKITASLPDLESGQCWVMSNELKKPLLIKVPEKNSQHPDRRAVSDPKVQKRKPVPADAFVEQMKAALAPKPSAAAEKINKQPVGVVVMPQADGKVLARQIDAAFAQGQESIRAMIPAMLDAQHETSFETGYRTAAIFASELLGGLKAEMVIPARAMTKEIKTLLSHHQPPGRDYSATIAPPSSAKADQSRPNGPQSVRIGPQSASSGLDKPLQKIIDAIRWWNVLHVTEPSHAQVGFMAGYAAGSGTWARYLSSLRSQGLIEPKGVLALTVDGLRAANEPDPYPDGVTARKTVLDRLDGPCRRILEPILDVHPAALSHEDAAAKAGYQAGSGTWARYLSTLRSAEVIEPRGALKAQDWLFPD